MGTVGTICALLSFFVHRCHNFSTGIREIGNRKEKSTVALSMDIGLRHRIMGDMT